MILWLVYYPKAEHDRGEIIIFRHLRYSLFCTSAAQRNKLHFSSSFITSERNDVNFSQGVNFLFFICL